MQFIKNKKIRLISDIAIICSGIAICISCTTQPPDNNSTKANNTAIINAMPFKIDQVQLLDGPFMQATNLNIKTLLMYEPDRFLSGFRATAGLTPKAQKYGGWESETLAGHSLGHYLSACALMYNTTLDNEFKNRANYIVNELYECQQAKGNGYIGAVDGAFEIFTNQIAKGDIRSAGFDLNGLWAPIYTQHKILQGLIDAHLLLGNNNALTVATKFADWIGSIIENLDTAQMEQLMVCEIGGINESMANLYQITKNKKYLDIAFKFYHKQVFEPLANNIDNLPGKHANTQIPKILGLARLYEITAADSLKNTVKFFFNRVANHHSYVTGGHCDHEYFGPPDTLRNRLSQQTTETCNVYNMLKLSRSLFMWEQSAQVADFYERALFNHILASQHPGSGQVVYNLALEMGGYKEFQDPGYFTCCIGTAMETHSKYPANIYFHNNNSLFAFQYIASKLNWQSKNIIVTQNTKYPESQKTSFKFECKDKTRFTFYVRQPYWCTSGFEITINNKKFRAKNQPGNFIAINRYWKNNDVVDINMPFNLRIESMPDDSTRIAIMYGPLVLAGELGNIDNPQAYNPDFVPVIKAETRNPKAWVIPVEDRVNTFKTVGVGQPRDVLLKPFYLCHDERYSVFWDIFNDESWKAYKKEYQSKLEEKKLLESLTIDFFQPGEMQPERDHKFTGDKINVGVLQGRKYREAYKSWMQCQMKVSANKPVKLAVEYWGAFSGLKTFDIFADNVLIATENISNANKGNFYIKTYNIPANITKNKQHVTIKFVAHKGHRAGPVFGIRTINQN